MNAFISLLLPPHSGYAHKYSGSLSKYLYKIKEGSAKKFVDMLTTNCHGAMLEHGTIYLTMQYGINREESDSIEKYTKNKYRKTIPEGVTASQKGRSTPFSIVLRKQNEQAD